MAIKPVEIVIKADDKATPEIKNVAKSMDAIAPAAQRAGASSDASLDGMYKRGRKAAEGIDSISQQLDFLQKAFVLFQGGGTLTGLIKDTAATADEYANLSARIKLATGEGEAFENAMAAVTEISLRTNSSLQATGNLFARLTEAGKSAGLGAQAAQTQALALTESINQAVAVSGSSAQASDAALTQLIQGLQSGVLRGEEFNSVMEQSPRLARALADGLGVTTGELRKMANEGRLTTEVVIGALKSQADTLKSEFETLPLTVGRAVQNLSTAWTLYVGETDKATGASRTAAQAIGALAENLDTIAGYLIDAGQAAAAFAALRLAQTFTGIGVAAAASATAVASSTAAMTAAGAAGTAAAVGVGRFAAILSTLKTFTLLESSRISRTSAPGSARALPNFRATKTRPMSWLKLSDRAWQSPKSSARSSKPRRLPTAQPLKRSSNSAGPPKAA
jgi:tape measure domain-containing protein